MTHIDKIEARIVELEGLEEKATGKFLSINLAPASDPFAIDFCNAITKPSTLKLLRVFLEMAKGLKRAKDEAESYGCGFYGRDEWNAGMDQAEVALDSLSKLAEEL